MNSNVEWLRGSRIGVKYMSMQELSYFFVNQGQEGDFRDDTVSLHVNCAGEVFWENLKKRSLRMDYGLMYVLNGEMPMHNCTLYPGDVIIYEPGYAFEYNNTGAVEYLWVHFTGYEAKSLMSHAVKQPNVKIHIGIREDIQACFQKLFQEFLLRDESSKQLMACLLKEILLLTGRYAEGEQKNNVPLEAMEYIHRHFKQNVDVAMLPQLEHMSGTAFRSAFKKHTGVSPNEYIISLRISEACRLLTQTDLKVGEVAAEIGYSDPYYFSRIFKKKMRTTPLKYRKNASVI